MKKQVNKSISNLNHSKQLSTLPNPLNNSTNNLSKNNLNTQKTRNISARSVSKSAILKSETSNRPNVSINLGTDLIRKQNLLNPINTSNNLNIIKKDIKTINFNRDNRSSSVEKPRINNLLSYDKNISQKRVSVIDNKLNLSITKKPQNKIDNKLNLFDSNKYVKNLCDRTNNTSISTNNDLISIESSVNLNLINLEHFILIEEKYTLLLEGLRNNNALDKLCYNWFHAQAEYKINSVFELDRIKYKAINEFFVLELVVLSALYTIAISNNNNKNKAAQNIAYKNAVFIIHQNFLIVFDYVINKFFREKSASNLWLNKANNIILTKIAKRIKRNDNILIIKQNNETILSFLKSTVAKNCNTEILNFIKNIGKTTITQVQEYFKSKILKNFRIETRTKNISINLFAMQNCDEDKNEKDNKIDEQTHIQENKIFLSPTVTIPYVTIDNHKPYTLVLDLDETMISFKINPDSKKGMLRIRPGLFEFLNDVSDHFDLLVFTAATQDYADPILDAIEQDKKYFSHRLYRHHASMVENELIKDLSKIGRDLSKTLIVDNIALNFKLQPDNGILIKTFEGEDEDDSSLINLTDILLNLAKAESKDLRKCLKKYNNDIISKVSCL